MDDRPIHAGHDADASNAGAAAAFVILGTLWAGIAIDEYRDHYRATRPVGGTLGGLPDAIFTCDIGYQGPAMLGWCQKGVFIGPVHFGSILAAISDESLYGIAQLTGFYGLISRDFAGVVQASAGANFVNQNFFGVAQVSLFNVTAGMFAGAMQGGLVNVSHEFFGIGQFGFWNSAKHAVGMQIAMYNGSDTTYGLKIGGFFNRGRTLRGLAVAGLANIHDEVSGVEAGFWSHSGDVHGAQLGVVNVADYVRGIQVGFFNWANHLEGVQLGAFNCHIEGSLPFMVGINLGFGVPARPRHHNHRVHKAVQTYTDTSDIVPDDVRPCDEAMKECVLECKAFATSNGYSTVAVSETDFIETCSEACSAGGSECQRASPVDRGRDFKEACFDVCTTEVFHYPSGLYRLMTEARIGCEIGCEAGVKRLP